MCGAVPLVYLQPNWYMFSITLITHLVGNGPTHPQMATTPAQGMLHTFYPHSWLMNMMNTWRHFDMWLCPHALLMDMFNHWKHFAMCFYRLIDMTLCWAFIQCLCVSYMGKWGASVVPNTSYLQTIHSAQQPGHYVQIEYINKEAVLHPHTSDKEANPLSLAWSRIGCSDVCCAIPYPSLLD